MRTVLHVTVVFLVLWLSGCGNSDKTQGFSSEALISMDINNSHSAISGQFGVPRTYRQIDTNGSFSPEGGVFYNGDAIRDGNSTIDFNQSDVALYSMTGVSNTKYYFATHLAEYPSYVVLSGELIQFSGGGEFDAPKSTAWVELSKYDKPILYDEKLYYITYNTEVYTGIQIKIEAEPDEQSLPFEVLAEGSAPVAGRVGKHYEKVVSSERLATLYASVGLDPEMADTVDFTQYSVLALVMGSTDTSNASIALKELNNVKNISVYTVVSVRNSFAVTSCENEQRYVPYQFVAVPTTVGELFFVDSAKPVACK